MENKNNKGKFKILFSNYKKSKAYEELLALSESDKYDNEYNNETNSTNCKAKSEEVNIPENPGEFVEKEFRVDIKKSTINFDEAIKISIKKLILSTLKYSLFLSLVESVVFLIFGLKSAIFGLFLGTTSMVFGLVSIAKGYKNYGIINFGSFSIPKMYMIRYFFYASTFLLAAILSSDPLWGIIGTFIGMINFKIVIFLFSWRW
ncbi:MAG: hypothetical protein ACK4R7_00030 [Fervidobacterium sp.]